MPYAPAGAIAAPKQVLRLPLDQLSPRPLCSISQNESATLDELAQSIRTNGLLRPITVQRRADGRFTVVSGNRRLMACRLLGMTHIDAVMLWPDPQHISTRELLQSLTTRRLHYMEQARALQALNTVCGMSREQLARYLDVSAAAVTDSISLCALDGELQVFLMEEGLSERIAHALAHLSDDSARLRIARQAAAEKLSVREVEALVSSAQTRCPSALHTGGRTICRMRDHRLYLNAIRAIVAQMQEAGAQTQLTERQTAGKLELTITLSTRKRRCQK